MAGRIVARNFYTAARWAGVRCNPVRFLSYNVQKFNSPSTKLLWGKSTNFPILAPATSFRFYGDDVKMTVRELEDRVLTVLQLFDKVDPEKLTLESNFINDLGLDSLDVVEIVMAFEDEFGVEIDDEQAEKMFSPMDAVKFLRQEMDIGER